MGPPWGNPGRPKTFWVLELIFIAPMPQEERSPTAIDLRQTSPSPPERVV